MRSFKHNEIYCTQLFLYELWTLPKPITPSYFQCDWRMREIHSLFSPHVIPTCTHIYNMCIIWHYKGIHRLEIASHQVSLCICIYLHVEFVMLTMINLRKTKNGSLVYLSLHFLKIFQVYYSFFGAPIHIRFGWTNHYIRVPRFYLSSFLHVDMTTPPNQ